MPAESIDRARPLMQAIVAASNAEAGCATYSYASDVSEPGLVRVFELWESAAAIEAHFETPHMKAWIAQREELGFYDREITRYEISGVAAI